MIARTHSAYQHGIYGEVAYIEAATQSISPSIQITGLPAEVVKESRERIRVALSLLGFDVPSRKILLHLSPANTRKEGSQFDLPMALAMLKADGCLPEVCLQQFGFLGELGLGGEVKKVRNVIPLILALRKARGISQIFVPEGNVAEAALIGASGITPVSSLGETIEIVMGKQEPRSLPPSRPRCDAVESSVTLDNVMGQRLAKRALEVSLAGQHHLLFIGSPGVGKSMLAGIARSLLPPLTEGELVELAIIHNAVSGDWEPTLGRPFRSPHHGVSPQGFVGGGTGRIIPGELSLAHRGVLFLDEFPEFRRDVLEGLREPMQNGEIQIHRLGHSFLLPARFTLVAAMNPCPCGYSMSPVRRCLCPRDKILNYRKRISGPLVDRIDLGVTMTNIEKGATAEIGLQERVKERIARTWEIQRRREKSELSLDGLPRKTLERLLSEKPVSMRGRQKLLSVARTIADLETEATIRCEHLEEAWALRCPEVHSLGG